MNLLHTRRSVLAAGLALAAVPLVGRAQAQPPLRILVGFPAGGSTDVVARHLALGLSELLQRSVVVDNRPGAGGQIAANVLKAAAPDGHTLFLSNSHALAMIPQTVRQPGYDPIKDFVPVGLVAISSDVLAVNPQVVGDGVRDLKGLVAWAKANAGKASVGVPAPASDPDFGVRILAKDFGGDLVSVPYRGDGPVVQDLIAGQIPAGIGSVGAMLPYAKTGKVRLIAVAAPQRLAAVPELATYEEQGLKGYAVSGFVAMMAPVGTPQDLLQRYDQAIAQVVRSPGFVAKVAELGVVATPGAPAELAARLRETTAAFASIVKRAGFQIP